MTNSFDANGRLAGVADGSRTYLSGLQYQGKGGSLSQLSLGNGTTQTFGLNDRFQMTEQELKKGSDVLQKYAYGYGQIDGSGNLDPTKNNGQLAQVESWIGANKQWTQKFTNDSIGRLKQSEERRGDTNALSYKQNFDFDRFGNMYRKAANNNPTGQQSPLPYTPIEETDISKQTNRFTTDTTYDDAGNVVTDDKFRTMSFAYDANGRMVKATRDQVPDALSVYDASGMRVAEYVNDVWRFMIYDIGGKLVAEYGGLQSTDEGGVKYVLQDWQGSTRAVVGNTGNVQSRSDYTAFGERIGTGGLRSSSQGFGKSGGLKQGYALTEKDDATGLDHTWFRKNENQAGRWTSPDPYNGSMSLGSPQSFNRYSYIENQPTNFIDPSGLNVAAPGYGWSCWITWMSDGDGSNFRITSVTCQVWNTGGGGGGATSGGSGTGTTRNDTRLPSQIDADCVHKKLELPFANAVTKIEAIKKDAEAKRNQILTSASIQDAAILIVAAGGLGFAAWADEAPPFGAIGGAIIGVIGATGYTAYQATVDWDSSFSGEQAAINLESALFENAAKQAYSDCLKK